MVSVPVQLLATVSCSSKSMEGCSSAIGLSQETCPQLLVLLPQQSPASKKTTLTWFPSAIAQEQSSSVLPYVEQPSSSLPWPKISCRVVKIWLRQSIVCTAAHQVCIRFMCMCHCYQWHMHMKRMQSLHNRTRDISALGGVPVQVLMYSYIRHAGGLPHVL